KTVERKRLNNMSRFFRDFFMYKVNEIYGKVAFQSLHSFSKIKAKRLHQGVIEWGNKNGTGRLKSLSTAMISRPRNNWWNICGKPVFRSHRRLFRGILRNCNW